MGPQVTGLTGPFLEHELQLGTGRAILEINWAFPGPQWPVPGSVLVPGMAHQVPGRPARRWDLAYWTGEKSLFTPMLNGSQPWAVHILGSSMRRLAEAMLNFPTRLPIDLSSFPRYFSSCTMVVNRLICLHLIPYMAYATCLTRGNGPFYTRLC
jgi:hypothetical protein